MSRRRAVWISGSVAAATSCSTDDQQAGGSWQWAVGSRRTGRVVNWSIRRLGGLATGQLGDRTTRVPTWGASFLGPEVKECSALSGQRKRTGDQNRSMARGWHGGVTSGVTLQAAGRQTTAIRGTEDGGRRTDGRAQGGRLSGLGKQGADSGSLVITTRIGAVGGTRGRHARISAKLRGAVAMGGMYESVGKAGRRLPSEPIFEILPIHLTVAENRSRSRRKPMRSSARTSSRGLTMGTPAGVTPQPRYASLR